MLLFMSVVGYPLGAMFFIWHFVHVKVGKNHLVWGLDYSSLLRVVVCLSVLSAPWRPRRVTGC